MQQSLQSQVVLVTGANGGLGQEFVEQALARGASRVYAASRRPWEWADDRVVPLQMDITDQEQVRLAAATVTDVDMVVNNAGVLLADDASLLTDAEDVLRTTLETNLFGSLRVARAFAPALARSERGTLVNILSAASWINVPTAYAVSKAAMWSASNALRLELRPQGTEVVALHVGMVDTPMSAHADVVKASPASVVTQTYDGVADGAWEILADEFTRDLKRKLGGPIEHLYGEKPRLDTMH